MVVSDWQIIDTTTSGDLVITILDYGEDMLASQEGPNPSNETEPCIRFELATTKAFPAEGTINGVDILGVDQGAIDLWVYGRSTSFQPFSIFFRVDDIGDLDSLMNGFSGYEVRFGNSGHGWFIRRWDNGSVGNTLLDHDDDWTYSAQGVPSTRVWYRYRVQWWVFGGILYVQVFLDNNSGAGFSQSTPIVSDATNSYAGDETTVGFSKNTSGDSFNHCFEGFRVYRRTVPP